MAVDTFAPPLKNLINLSVERSCFPNDLKKSELSRLYKCKDSLVSGNYRRLSIRPSVLKNFEKIYNQQLYEYCKHVLSDLLSVFRKRYGCQHTCTDKIDRGEQTGTRQSHAYRAFTARSEQSLRLFTTQVTYIYTYIYANCMLMVYHVNHVHSCSHISVTEGKTISS